VTHAPLPMRLASPLLGRPLRAFSLTATPIHLLLGHVRRLRLPLRRRPPVSGWGWRGAGVRVHIGKEKRRRRGTGAQGGAPLNPTRPLTQPDAPSPNIAPLSLFLFQAATNFGKELRALRETTRFGPPLDAPPGTPPSTSAGRAVANLGAKVVAAFCRLDLKLEAAGVLPRLAAPGEPGGPPLPPSRDLGITRVRAALATLTLNDAAVWEKEKARGRAPGAPKPPLLVKGFYLALCWVLDTMYAGRPIQVREKGRGAGAGG